MTDKIRVGLRDAIGMLGPYIRTRLLEQVKSVWLIIVYLILFQTIVLRIPVAQGSVIAIGIGLVIVGLTVFMEGLILGLMPLGERVGIRLPQRVGLITIVLFAFLLGLLATLAEPAIQVLQAAGKSVNAWEAPLLFLLLNSHAKTLVLSVGGGVGLAVAIGMIRFYYSWSLKPLICLLVGALLALTAWAFFDPNLRFITGLAWDCGAVTTGPVTVPLVLALGVGIARMVGTGESGATGFGVVTLASLFPILTVFCLAIALVGAVPDPMDEAAFFDSQHRPEVRVLFEDEDHMAAYALVHAGLAGRTSYFGEDTDRAEVFARRLAGNRELRKAIFKNNDSDFVRWIRENGSPELQAEQTGEEGGSGEGASAVDELDAAKLFRIHLSASIQAILLLTVPLLLILLVLLREKMPFMDEILLGLVFAVAGLCIFSAGIELGLDRLGRQVGSMLPASFQAIDLPRDHETICPFSTDLIQTAVTPDGREEHFFFLREGKHVRTVPYLEEQHDPETGCYRIKASRGPLFGREGTIWGIAVVLVFAFVMGYGATLAEPALNALGMTVEELTAGTFRKKLLMHSVAVGVGLGIAVGVAKIVWDIPLAWLLVPSYAVLLPITLISSEEFVNIGWDSAGVTTGPITVPLVLAIGLGIGARVGVVEGFGILAAASVFPILTVLVVGLYLNVVRRAILKSDLTPHEEGREIHG